MGNFLILGGAGFIGTNLSDALLQNNHNHVVIFDQKAVSKPYFDTNSHISYFHGDFHNPLHLEECFQKNQFDAVIHLISILLPGSENFMLKDEIDTVIKPTYFLIDLMAKYNVKNILFFSSGGTIYGVTPKKSISEETPPNPINIYGYSKLMIEYYLKFAQESKGINYLIVRPSNVYGIGSNWLRNQGIIPKYLYNLLTNQPIEIWGDGNIIRDYIYIGDVCKAVSMLLEEKKYNHIYNIGSGQGYSIFQIKDLILKNTIGFHKVVFKEARKVDVPYNVLDISKIKSDLGWQPSVTIENGIQLTYNWMKKQIDNV